MSKGTLNLELVRGDSLSVPCVMTDNQTVPVAINLTATTITSDIKRNKSSTVADLSFTVTMTDAVNGEFTLSLTPEQTVLLKVTKDDESNIYWYDVEFDYGSGVITTEFGGTITVIEQVTI